MFKPHLLPLILKTASGDGEAFEQLIISQKNFICYTIRGITNCREDIEDICQEVAIIVFQRIGSLKRPEAFLSWLHTLVVRVSLRLVRARIRLVAFDNDDGLDILYLETDSDCLPAAHIERLELRCTIRTALGRMPETLRIILALYYFRGMRCREIADLLGTTTGAVSVYLSRARDRMRKELPLP